MKLAFDMILDGAVFLVNFSIWAAPWAVGIYSLLSLASMAAGIKLPFEVLIRWNPS